MRFYTKQHPYYCGIELHTKKMYVCILNGIGEIVAHRNLYGPTAAITVNSFSLVSYPDISDIRLAMSFLMVMKYAI